HVDVVDAGGKEVEEGVRVGASAGADRGPDGGGRPLHPDPGARQESGGERSRAPGGLVDHASDARDLIASRKVGLWGRRGRGRKGGGRAAALSPTWRPPRSPASSGSLFSSRPQSPTDTISNVG